MFLIHDPTEVHVGVSYYNYYGAHVTFSYSSLHLSGTLRVWGVTGQLHLTSASTTFDSLEITGVSGGQGPQVTADSLTLKDLSIEAGALSVRDGTRDRPRRKV